MNNYVRDHRSPIPTSEAASKMMSSIKAKNTKPEVDFRKLLNKAGVKGYRLHWKIEGRPDIAYVSKKIAIFIHGCFWHSCPNCRPPVPKSNHSFWSQKLQKNVERDKIKAQSLENNGWKVFIFWECEIKEKPQELITA